jgi:methyl-accepting chemotaxis protein
MKTLVRERRHGVDSGSNGSHLLDSAAALMAVVNGMQTRVMVADLDLNLVFVNDLAMATLRKLEPQLISSFRVSVDQLLGGSIHRFHKDPARIEQILRNVGQLPRPVSFAFGGHTLQGFANALMVGGRHVGYVVNWEDMTEELARVHRAEEDAADARAVQQAMTALSNARTPDDAARAAIEAVRTGFGWAYGSYWKLDPDTSTLRFQVEVGDAGEEFRRVSRNASFAEGVGLSGRAWRSRDLVFVKDLAEITDCARAPVAQRAGVKSGVCFPVQVNGKVVGTMDFFATEVLDPSRNRLDTLKMIGQLVSQTLERLLTQQRERERAEAIAANAQALAAASEELQVVAVQMGTNSTTTSSEVQHIASASVQVSQSIESVSAGAEEMSASIKEIAKNAADATRVADQAVEAARFTTDVVAKLGESSTEIGQIVKVITGIAQQTNLLALNATIEAARAGEAGKGFAVVANEVKELAKETAKATEDISQKIEAIQGDTSKSVDAIQTITSVIGQIADFQTTIASAVEEQAATTNDMARSVTEASHQAGRITVMLSSVSEAAESTASGAIDSQQAATELAQLAATLHSLVDDGR